MSNSSRRNRNRGNNRQEVSQNTNGNNDFRPSNQRVEQKVTEQKRVTYFQQLINASDNDLLNRRGDLVMSGTERSITTKLNNLKDKRDKLQLTLYSLEDLGKTNTTSLLVGQDFDPDKWIDEVFNIENELLLIDVDIETYTRMYDKYFQ